MTYEPVIRSYQSLICSIALFGQTGCLVETQANVYERFMCGMMAKEVKREEKSEQADEDKEDTAGWFFVLSQVCSEICRSYIQL